jgi:hypothetical protein
MVYFHPQNPDSFSISSVSNSRPVEVLYNGTGLHTIAGPVPFVDISHSVIRNGAGEVEGHSTRIDITGKIVKTGADGGPTLVSGSGIGPVISGINTLRDLFSKTNFGVLEIKCGVTSTLFAATGVKVLDMSFNKSENNWLYTADYAVNLEYYQPSGLTAGFYVQSTSDSWSIEPLEDATISNFNQSVSSKGEIYNPKLLPSAPSQSSPVPGSFNGAGNIGNGTLSIYNIPQYRISHRVSAVGIPSGTGAVISSSAYLEAKRWVENRLSTAFYQASPMSGLGHFLNNQSPQVSSFNGTFLYNHLRNTSFSVSDGNYEINDTWLAMPSGVNYLEDYSIDASTDDKFIKTVRVQGQIRGLNITPFNIMSGSPTSMVPNSTGLIKLSDNTGLLSSTASPHQVPDVLTSTSTVANIEPNKYQNALSGWISDIKPYLYRRACLVINSSDRTESYVDSTSPGSFAKNPLYTRENLLNTNPTSTTEGHDPRKGTISYSVEYNNRLNLISGVLSENISINDTGPADVFGESFIIGRRLGPIIQSLNAKTSSRKDVSVDVTVVPPSSIAGLLITNTNCPLYTGGRIYGQINELLTGLAPFGSRPTSIFGNIQRGSAAGQVFISQDNQSWNPTDGRYSRNVSWVYQQCNNSTSYLDH